MVVESSHLKKNHHHNLLQARVFSYANFKLKMNKCKISGSNCVISISQLYMYVLQYAYYAYFKTFRILIRKIASNQQRSGLSWQKPDQTKESTKINRKLLQYFQRWPWKSQITCNRKTEIKSIMFCCVYSSALYFFIVTIQLLALFLATKFRRNIINCHLVGHHQLQTFCTSAL